jgi:hypothetical protein
MYIQIWNLEDSSANVLLLKLIPVTSLVYAIRLEETTRGTGVKKKEIYPYKYDMIVYVENPRESMIKLTQIIM